MLKGNFFTTIILITLGIAVGLFGSRLLIDYGPSNVYASIDDERCKIHGMALNLCSRCNPELIEKFKAAHDWCAEHNLPESQCDLCRGEDEDEHGEDCDHGHEQDHEQDNALAGEHHDDEPHKTSEISVFFPENSSDCASDEAVIQLASIKTVERAGISVQRVMTAPLSPVIEAPAEIVFDENYSTVITTTIPVLVTKWLVEPGQRVKKNDVLADLSSPEMPKLKAEYLEAHADWQLANNKKIRQEELHKKELISDSQLEDAEAYFQAAEAHLIGIEGLLKSAGLSGAELDEIINDRAINRNFKLWAPVDGIIVERKAVPGELLSEGEALAMLADPDFLWIEARVREHEASRLKLGALMEFATDQNNLQKSSGEVIWIAQFLDRETRTAVIRAQVKSRPENLHSGEFGRAIIHTDNETPTVLIPKDAVQWEGCCNIVFVKETVDRYHPRKVQIEPGTNEYYRVIDGLRESEEIVVNGSFLLKTELRKSQIGVGCSGHLH
jgi:cobalt-zinc-cadmium efflux system membrane fusion protein